MTDTGITAIDTRIPGDGAGHGAPEPPPEPAASDRYPWIVLFVVAAATFLVWLDSTIVNVALPQIGIDLDQRAGIEWVVTSYLLAVGLVQLPAAWLADRYGRKNLLVASIVTFGVGSLFAALSPSLPVLVAMRVVQGAGGGVLMPVGLTMVYELFPADRRGTALGIFGVANMAAPAFGPVLGGYVVTAVNWHWLFFINVPICVVVTACAMRMLHETGYREARRFDGIGLGLISVALVAWLLAFAQAGTWGWGSTPTTSLLVLGLVTLVAFLAWEHRHPEPLVDLDMFRVPIYALTVTLVMTSMIVQFGVMVFVPLQLETLRGFSALRVGVIVTPMAFAAAATIPLAGRLTDRIGPRPPVLTGSLLLCVSAMVLARLDSDASELTLMGALALQGLGVGIAIMPNTVAGLNALGRRFVASATAARMLLMRVGGAFGIAVLAAILASRLDAIPSALHGQQGPDAHAAYRTVFYIVAGIAACNACLACFLPNRARTQELIGERAAELREAASTGDTGLHTLVD